MESTGAEEMMVHLEPYCRRLIRRYGSCPELRQDLVGEVYCMLHDLLGRYEAARGIPLHAYLRSRLRSGIFTYARSQWRLRAREPLGGALTQETGEPSWSEQVTTRLTVHRALSRLTCRQREVVYRRYYCGEDFAEIAHRLSITPATARSLLRHGLERLRVLLGD